MKIREELFEYSSCAEKTFLSTFDCGVWFSCFVRVFFRKCMLSSLVVAVSRANCNELQVSSHFVV